MNLNSSNIKKVTFVCGENAGRSQMAEAFFNFYAKEKGVDWIAESAGMYPSSHINPIVVEVMSEKGIDLSKTHPKKFDPERASDYRKIISFGCIVKTAFTKEIQARIIEWHIDDPQGKNQDEVRNIRDTVEYHVKELINTLTNIAN